MNVNASLSMQLMLGIKPGSKVSLINAPHGFVDTVGPLPEGAEYLSSARTGLDVIIFFCHGKRELLEKLPGMVRGMAFTGSIWVMFAHARSNTSDGLVEDFVRFAALEMGLMDNKHFDVDPQWRGLRLVWQRRNPRPEKPSADSGISCC